ncbi:hypothetical protein IAH97_02585 [Neoehrlichia mikurensis]|nr:hypothetical protein [Neoehrlichia mikurensis]QXK91648.1 hypothetical protein IAH97_02585 [Neoehrlichia mikurensis]QXK92859.1 hypothetical protein HUN61_02580 [Neoehrlichia mikurensis]
MFFYGAALHSNVSAFIPIPAANLLINFAEPKNIAAGIGMNAETFECKAP